MFHARVNGNCNHFAEISRILFRLPVLIHYSLLLPKITLTLRDPHEFNQAP